MIPDLGMKPLTRDGRRILVIQSLHPRGCACTVCYGCPTDPELRAAERHYDKETLDAVRRSLDFNTHGGKRK